MFCPGNGIDCVGIKLFIKLLIIKHTHIFVHTNQIVYFVNDSYIKALCLSI